MNPEDKSFVEEIGKAPSLREGKLISIIEKLDLALQKCKWQRDKAIESDHGWGSPDEIRNDIENANKELDEILGEK